jgi:hypothetical protein
MIYAKYENECHSISARRRRHGDRHIVQIPTPTHRHTVQIPTPTYRHTVDTYAHIQALHIQVLVHKLALGRNTGRLRNDYHIHTGIWLSRANLIFGTWGIMLATDRSNINNSIPCITLYKHTTNYQLFLSTLHYKEESINTFAAKWRTANKVRYTL